MSNAILSDDGVYRYYLGRHIPLTMTPEVLRARRMTFIMLNPSTADARVDDPTIRRCAGFAAREKCICFDVVNLFAYRATKPDDLITAFLQGVDVQGPENHEHVRHALQIADIAVAAWGAGIERMHKIGICSLAGLVSTFPQVMCLGTTKDGHPRHPLYVRKDQPLELWRPESATDAAEEG